MSQQHLSKARLTVQSFSFKDDVSAKAVKGKRVSLCFLHEADRKYGGKGKRGVGQVEIVKVKKQLKQEQKNNECTPFPFSLPTSPPRSVLHTEGESQQPHFLFSLPKVSERFMTDESADFRLKRRYPSSQIIRVVPNKAPSRATNPRKACSVRGIIPDFYIAVRPKLTTMNFNKVLKLKHGRDMQERKPEETPKELIMHRIDRVQMEIKQEKKSEKNIIKIARKTERKIEKEEDRFGGWEIEDINFMVKTGRV